jgi:uncharacterized OB-fold protein
MIHEGSIRIPFNFAAGEIGSRFLIALRDDKQILGGRCEKCERVACPPQPFCSLCGHPTTELQEVGPGGTLKSWAEMADGRVFGLIQLDGADGSLLHLLLGDAGAWSANGRVSAIFADERTGGIKDIAGFESSSKHSRN